MDQEKIGKFIAKQRKEHNLTQKELAEKLNLTYKAVSKWETGKGLPDVSLYESICEILEISLNEFFAGEKLNETELIEKSEQNILAIAKAENKSRKNYNKVFKASLIIIVILIIFIFGSYKYFSYHLSVSNTFKENWNINLPNDFVEEYYIDSGSSFLGDGERYSVFSGNSFMVGLNDEENKEMEDEVTKLFKTLKVKKAYQIDFSHKYKWTKISQDEDKRTYIYCIYDCVVNKFYFYENIF